MGSCLAGRHACAAACVAGNRRKGASECDACEQYVFILAQWAKLCPRLQFAAVCIGWIAVSFVRGGLALDLLYQTSGMQHVPMLVSGVLACELSTQNVIP